MTTAIAEGRDLHLGVQGIERPFVVHPLPARRGKQLTDVFVQIAVQGPASVGADAAMKESIFIEAFGPENYARAGSGIVELTLDGEILATWIPDAEQDLTSVPPVNPDPSIIFRRGGDLSMREPRDDEPPAWGESIRHEEIEALALAAFYWQTVVGMEAVQAFLEAGEGQAGSLKALGLLLSRRGLSIRTNSSDSGSASSTQQAGSTGTTATAPRSAIEQLPAHKRSKKKRKG